MVTEHCSGDGWRLVVYRPEGAADPVPGVIVLPGSVVSSSAAALSALFASHGRVSGTLYYTRQPGLPDAFVRIPIESIAAAMRRFIGLPYVDESAIAVHAASVGVQTALSTLSHTPDITPRAVVLVAPSHVVFQGIRIDGPPAKAAIPVENIHCPILSIAGEHDRSYPAAAMARALHERRGRGTNPHARGDQPLTYPMSGTSSGLPRCRPPWTGPTG